MPTFLERIGDIERRLETAKLKQEDCISSCDEIFKRLLDTLRKEHEKRLVISENQKQSISALESKLQDEMKKVQSENAKSYDRLSRLVEVRFERINAMVRAKLDCHNSSDKHQLARQDPTLPALIESYENECSLIDCCLEMKMHATFDGLHSAVLRERTLRELDEAKLAVDLEVAVPTLSAHFGPKPAHRLLALFCPLQNIRPPRAPALHQIRHRPAVGCLKAGRQGRRRLGPSPVRTLGEARQGRPTSRQRIRTFRSRASQQLSQHRRPTPAGLARRAEPVPG